MTTKKNANTVQKRAPDGNADPVSILFHPERRKRNAAAPLPLLPATQEIRTAAIRNRRTVPVFRRTPCTISVLFRKNLTMTTMRKIFRKSSAAGHPQNRPLRRSLTKRNIPKASMGDTKPYTSPSKPQITEDGIPGCRSLRDPAADFRRGTENLRRRSELVIRTAAQKTRQAKEHSLVCRVHFLS